MTGSPEEFTYKDLPKLIKPSLFRMAFRGSLADRHADTLAVSIRRESVCRSMNSYLATIWIAAEERQGSVYQHADKLSSAIEAYIVSALLFVTELEKDTRKPIGHSATGAPSAAELIEYGGRPNHTAMQVKRTARKLGTDVEGPELIVPAFKRAELALAAQTDLIEGRVDPAVLLHTLGIVLQEC